MKDEAKNCEWKPVVGYEGVYSISSNGSVRRDSSGRILSKMLRKGYFYVNLCSRGISQKKDVHQLVGEAFLSLRPVGMQINHRDGCKTNNEASNLEWVTPSENALHAYRM